MQWVNVFKKVAVLKTANTSGEDLMTLPLTPKSKIKHISTGLILRQLSSATARPMMYLQATEREVPVNF